MRRYLETPTVVRRADRSEALSLQPNRVGPSFDEAFDLFGSCVGRQVEIGIWPKWRPPAGRAGDRVAHRAADEIDVVAGIEEPARELIHLIHDRSDAFRNHERDGSWRRLNPEKRPRTFMTSNSVESRLRASGDRTEDVSPLACFPSRRSRAFARIWSVPLALAVAALMTSTVFESTATAASANASGRTSVELTSESNWVGAHSQMHISFHVDSSLPTTALGVKLTLYSRLTSRYAFGQSETGREPSSEIVLGATPIIPLSLLFGTASPNSSASLNVRVVTAPTARPTRLTSPVLALDCQPGSCNGVYPLDLAIVDRATDKPLASFTTDVIYLTGTAGTYPLNVALVFSLGTGLGLSPAGTSMISLRRVVDLDEFVRALAAQPRTAVTINAYSQILLALDRSTSKLAKATLKSLRSLVLSGEATGNFEILDSPFTEVSAAQLTHAGLGRDLALQFATGHAIAHRLVGALESHTPYLATTNLDAAGVAALQSAGITRLVVPEANVTPAPVTTPTSPFTLRTTNAKSPVAFVADAGLAAQLRSSEDPVLAAHNFLADLAQTFFEEPFSTGPRGVVVAPIELPTSSRLTSIVLRALNSSPILHPTTLGRLYSSIPLGSNGTASSANLTGTHGFSGRLGRKIDAARSMLSDLRSVIPSDTTLLGEVRDAILLAETNGIAGPAESRYLAAPNDNFAVIRRSLALSGTRTVTIGQHNARVPVTFDSSFPTAVHADLRLSSDAFALSPSEVSTPLVLARKNTEHEVTVTTRTSGVSTLDIELVSPVGKVVLLQGGITIRSTAFSIVAVIISAIALFILLAWWVRTMLRRRRRHAHERELLAESTPASS